MLVEDQKLDAVVKLPGGVFRPYAGVSTAILLFTKTNSGGTDRVWFYEIEAERDGWSTTAAGARAAPLPSRAPLAYTPCPMRNRSFAALDLVGLPKLGGIEVLGREVTGDTIRLRVHFRFTGHLPAAVTAVVGAIARNAELLHCSKDVCRSAAWAECSLL